MKIVKDIQSYLKENPDEFIDQNVDSVLAVVFLLEKEMEINTIKIKTILNNCEKILKSMMHNILNSELPKSYLIFCQSYIELVYNLNVNTLKVPDIDLFCLFINKNIQMIMILRDSINIFKESSIKLKEWALFSPPSYGISINLLEEVLKE